MENNYCVIMAGGIGSRFWPMSRDAKPKQFLDILGTGQSLIQATHKRFLKVCPPENIYIVTNEKYRGQIKEQLGVSDEQILGEPDRRNTAPCIAYAAYKILAKNPDANMVVAPSDHIIKKEEDFTTAIRKALDFTAANDSLLTLGIQPSRPDTGYGYIQFISDNGAEKNEIYKVQEFKEKPILEDAKNYIASGNYLWNAGIFIWNAKTITRELEDHLPEIGASFKEGNDKYNSDGEKAFINKIYPECQSISIDFGVMERSKHVHVMAAEFGWSDLGTYGSLYEHLNKDTDGNAVIGKNVMTYNSSNCIVNVPSDKLVIMQGLDDYIVIESDGTLLICKKQDEQQIKQFVKDVKDKFGDQFA